jgi:nucleoid-associated protein YgaU
MANRYARDRRLKAGSTLGTNQTARRIQLGISQGRINVKRHVMRDGERLDHLAGKFYGDSSLWWVIAAASKIGWCLQLPAGTVAVIPTSLAQVEEFTG